ncbi:MAG: amino acid permease [Candidatus Eisenbacteria bacterium]|uniref:Amino acid permease n=1 Tax=Eiseniibacteriota bacterium TaxID=2212470 RepID=A0A849SNU8_UNCEI|nr:amino acid permease [Candidatus Eisenbacteria bacterium]
MSRRAAAGPAIPIEPTRLARRLGTLDGALLTIGAVVGTGIFLTAGDVAAAVRAPALVIGVWIGAGLLTLAGALAYAELGAMLPRAGGLYHFLAEAWGPVWGFLFGWACFLVIMSGGIAAISIGFGEYLVGALPGLELALAPLSRTLRTGAPQLVAAAGIVVLTAVNHFGVRSGATTQNLFTFAKALALFVLGLAGLAAGGGAAGLHQVAGVASDSMLAGSASGSAFAGAAWGGLSVALIAALWTYDGWYALTFSAGELREPARSLPRGLLIGVAAVVVLYALVNLAYLRVLPIEQLSGSRRVAEATAAALWGASAGRAIAWLVVVSSFGCLAATILYSSRLYGPIAEAGHLPSAFGAVHPRWRVPVVSLWAQSAWAVALTLSGTYASLYTMVVFVGIGFHVAAVLGLFRLRITHAALPRPYRAWGYPVLPLMYAIAMLALAFDTLRATPRESTMGLLLTLAGLPAFALWRRFRSGKSHQPPGDVPTV